MEAILKVPLEMRKLFRRIERNLKNESALFVLAGSILHL
jgi:hypothetical protein